MNKREQLNTDIAINTLISMNVNNLLLLGLSKNKFRSEDFDTLQEQIGDMAEAIVKLSDKASKLDEEGL